MHEPNAPLTACGKMPQPPSRSIAALEHLDEGVLRDIHLAEHLHLLFPLFLLLEQLALARDVTAVALGGDVFAHGGDGFAGDDLAADGGLDGDDEEVVWNDFLELAGEHAAV